MGCGAVGCGEGHRTAPGPAGTAVVRQQSRTGGSAALVVEAAAAKPNCQGWQRQQSSQDGRGCKGSRAVEPRQRAVSTADLAKDGQQQGVHLPGYTGGSGRARSGGLWALSQLGGAAGGCAALRGHGQLLEERCDGCTTACSSVSRDRGSACCWCRQTGNPRRLGGNWCRSAGFAA